MVAFTVKGEYDVKLLGVYVDSKLNFDTHTKYICGRAAQQINVLCRYARLLDTATKLAIYKSFVLYVIPTTVPLFGISVVVSTRLNWKY